MDKKFECFVEIRDQKYGIVLSKSYLFAINFKDIYPKIQEVVKLVLNECIDFKTHEFEIFKENSTQGSVVRVVDQYIDHQNIIRVKPKPQLRISSSSHFIPLSDSPKVVSTQTQAVIGGQPQALNRYVESEHSPEDSIRYHSYCNVCPILTDRNSNSLFSKKWLNTQSKHFHMYQKLLDKIIEICGNNYDNITETDWLHVIPKHMKQFDGNINWRKKFRKLCFKYIETLKCCPNPVLACNGFPYFHYFESIAFDVKQEPFNQINRLRNNRGMSSHQTIENSNKFNKIVKTLIEGEVKIKAFYSIVMAIDRDIKSHFKDCVWNKCWPKICDKIMVDGSPFPLKSKVCAELFTYWSKFYSQNYDQINGKLDPKHQQIFDMLKVIHILELSKVFKIKNNIYKKLNEISMREEFQHYNETHLKRIRTENVVQQTQAIQLKKTNEKLCDCLENTKQLKTRGKRTLETESEDIISLSSQMKTCSTNQIKKLKPTLTIFLD